MSEILWYLSFSAWLILLSIIHSTSIHVVANGKISFFLMAEWYSTQASLSIHQSMGIWALCIIGLLLIMLLWTLGCMYPFELAFLYPLDKYLVVQLLDHRVVLFWTFWGTFILFSTVAAPVCIPTNSAWGFLPLCILTNTCCFLCC